VVDPKDIAWYRANRPQLVRDYLGKWVLIKNQGLVGAYAAYKAALADGVAMFGPTEPGFIHHVLDPEPVETVR
jgi:hypothetical protein